LVLPAAEPTFFIQIADTQYGHHSRPRNKDFAQETATNEFVVASINRLKPAFVVVCGDLTNEPRNRKQIAEYKRVMGRVDPAIQVYNVPGNHDVDDEPTEASLDAYIRAFGPDHYVLREGNITGLVLNAPLLKYPEKAALRARAQDEWLRSSLARARQEKVRVLVFQHQPWFISAVDEEDGYYNMPLRGRRSYLDLMVSSGVKAIFSGHTHNNLVGLYKSISMITAGAAGGEANGGSRNGFSAVIVRDSGIEQRYYDLGWIPNRIDPRDPLPGPPPPSLPR
jgi:3',5'-cyclic AMP phosphodiesterase CpdA